jgi:hypothetical protein
MNLKTLFLFGFLICSFILAFSQSEKLESRDSMEVDTERIAISQELPLLRDSISRFIKIVRVEIRKSPPSKKETLEKSMKELSDLRSSVSADIKEISQDKPTREVIQRIRANTLSTRNEFKRWTEILMITGEELSDNYN